MSCCNREMTHWTEALNLTIKFHSLLEKYSEASLNYVMTKMTEQRKNWKASHNVRDDSITYRTPKRHVTRDESFELKIKFHVLLEK